MRAVIVENEKDAYELLSNLILEYHTDISIVGQAVNVSDALKIIEDEEPDIVFLDIDLDDGTAFDLLDAIEHPDFAVIFTTAFDAYALKAFKYNAVDYLLKPYSISELRKSIEKAEASLNTGMIYEKLKTLINQIQGRSKGNIPIYTVDGISIYQVDDIIRFEGDRAYCKLILNHDKEVIVSKPLKEVESILPMNIFFRVHKSHLININYVSKYAREEGGYITMKNGDQVPLSRRKKDEFVNFLMGDH